MKNMKNFKKQQSGFTLVEIAIVLVIIGLLLGGILKGQELINSAKVKSYAQDFRTVQAALYGYQDRFKAIPGDHASAATSLTGAHNASSGGTLGNGQIEGDWNSTNNTEESCVAWEHLRLAGFLAGNTTINCAAGGDYTPKNPDGGRTGISSKMLMQTPTPMTGSYNICSTGVLGKIAKQLDTQLDDGNAQTGSFRIADLATSTAAKATADVFDSNSYIVCMSF